MRIPLRPVGRLVPALALLAGFAVSGCWPEEPAPPAAPTTPAPEPKVEDPPSADPAAAGSTDAPGPTGAPFAPVAIDPLAETTEPERAAAARAAATGTTTGGASRGAADPSASSRTGTRAGAVDAGSTSPSSRTGSRAGPGEAGSSTAGTASARAGSRASTGTSGAGDDPAPSRAGTRTTGSGGTATASAGATSSAAGPATTRTVEAPVDAGSTTARTGSRGDAAVADAGDVADVAGRTGARTGAAAAGTGSDDPPPSRTGTRAGASGVADPAPTSNDAVADSWSGEPEQAVRRFSGEDWRSLREERVLSVMNEPGPGTDPSCYPRDMLPIANKGKLTKDQVACVQKSLSQAQYSADQARLSLVLISNAQARQEVDNWEWLVARHLESIDDENPALAYRYALHLYQKGRASYPDALVWANTALGQRAAWSGSVYHERVTRLYKLRAAAAQALWQQAEDEWARSPSDSTRENVISTRERTRQMALEWYRYAVETGMDASTALQLCANASIGESCEGAERF